MMAQVRVVYANDLSSVPHFGCELVNGNLKQAIREMAILAGTIAHDRLVTPQAFRMLHEGDVLVINGEGNFHSKNPRKLGEIMALATEGKRLGKRVALINTVGQNIPNGLDLTVFDFVSVRESDSAGAFREARYQGELMVAPDGTLLTEYMVTTRRQDRIVVTDSVLSHTRQALRALARDLHEQGVDVVYAPFHRKWKNVARAWFLRDWFRGTSVEQMLALFASARLVVSGRFHANCFALITQTPVISVDSNTHKIKSMMRDFGMADQQHFENFDKLRAFVLGSDGARSLNLSASTPAQQIRARQAIQVALQKALGLPTYE